MVKSPRKGAEEEPPPKIPPRMKRSGPALPEKPPHIQAALRAQQQQQQQQPPREPLRPRNQDPRSAREVLVAASRGAARERPVERRQREPAKLLAPTSGGGRREVRREAKKSDYPLLKSEPGSKSDEGARKQPPSSRGTSSAPPHQPLLLIPRGLLTTWTPVSYALWSTQRGVRGPQPQPQRSASGSVVVRSGSLTSQGSSGSDSGGETFPKSVLKKQRRESRKKNVTFNAFATVQLVGE